MEALPPGEGISQAQALKKMTTACFMILRHSPPVSDGKQGVSSRVNGHSIAGATFAGREVMLLPKEAQSQCAGKGSSQAKKTQAEELQVSDRARC